MADYVRVTYRDALSGKTQTRTLQVLNETERWLHGRPVNREGIETGDAIREGTTPEQRVVTRQEYLIEKACISRRTVLEMDVHYGELVPPERLSAQHKAFMAERSE